MVIVHCYMLVFWRDLYRFWPWRCSYLTSCTFQKKHPHHSHHEKRHEDIRQYYVFIIHHPWRIRMYAIFMDPHRIHQQKPLVWFSHDFLPLTYTDAMRHGSHPPAENRTIQPHRKNTCHLNQPLQSSHFRPLIKWSRYPHSMVASMGVTPLIALEGYFFDMKHLRVIFKGTPHVLGK